MIRALEWAVSLNRSILSKGGSKPRDPWVLDSGPRLVEVWNGAATYTKKCSATLPKEANLFCCIIDFSYNNGELGKLAPNKDGSTKIVNIEKPT